MPFYKHRKETECLGQRWRHCVLCGQNYSQYEIFFTNASAEPAIGEVLTGATSGKTATVSEVNKLNGDASLGTENGMVVVTSPSGDFTDGEILNGSVGGDAMATCHYFAEKRYGISYPESQLVTYEGKEYCREHFGAIARSKIVDKSVPNITDID
jgi:hypothetical protein